MNGARAPAGRWARAMVAISIIGLGLAVGCAPEVAAPASPAPVPRAIPTLVAAGSVAPGPPTAAAATPVRTTVPLVGKPLAGAAVAPGIAPGDPGSLAHPVFLGDSFELKREGRTFRLRVDEVHWSAGAEVQEVNPRNPDPPEGGQYMLLKLSLTYLESGDDAPYITEGEYQLVAADQLWDEPAASIPPEPAFAGRTIARGDTVEGWLPPRYGPTDALQNGLMLYQGVFFSFKFSGQ